MKKNQKIFFRFTTSLFFRRLTTTSMTVLAFATISLLTSGGCGGGKGGGIEPTSSPSPSPSVIATTRAKVTIDWPARSRAEQPIPSSALSAVITLTSAAVGGGNITWTVNREASRLEAHSATYESPEPASLATSRQFAEINFYTQPDGAGSWVGQCFVNGDVATDGSGLPKVTTDTGVAFISAVEVPEIRLQVGETKGITFTAKSTRDAAVALTPGSAFVSLVSGQDKVELIDGDTRQVKGLTPGTARVRVAVDGKVGEADVVVESPVLVTLDPLTVEVAAGKTHQFTATVTGTTETGINWSVQEGDAGGTITEQGLYTPPTTLGTYHVVASAKADPAKTAVSTVTVTQPQYNLTVLHSFTGSGDEGAGPFAGLILSGNTLYGTTAGGGTYENNNHNISGGTVFSLNTDGTGFRTLHSFSQQVRNGFGDDNLGNEGNRPKTALVLSGNTLYGTALGGGCLGYGEGCTTGTGSVFSIHTDGTEFTPLHYFGNPEVHPQGLVIQNNKLFGSCSDGFDGKGGAVFSLSTNGTDYNVLRRFGMDANRNHLGTIVLSEDILYGVTGLSESNSGTVFAINTDGTGYKILHQFPRTGKQGISPAGELVRSGNTLYGVCYEGGSDNFGTVFAVSIDGTNFRVLHNFKKLDGIQSNAALILSGNTLFGTTTNGGKYDGGTVFAVNTDGSAFHLLYSFSDAGPNGSIGALLLSNNTLYGTTNSGGDYNKGSVFALEPAL